MKRVIIGWELGEGGGHLERIKIICLSLLNKGCYILFICPDLTASARCFDKSHETSALFRRFIDSGRLKVIEKKAYKKNTELIRSNSLCDVLFNHGYGDGDWLQSYVKFVEGVLKRFRPDLVICDFAPGLRIATTGRVETIVVGNGWSMPPECKTLPPFHVFGDTEQFNNHEHSIQEAIRFATDGRLVNLPLSGILRGNYNILLCCKLLDPYSALRDDRYYWPVEIESTKIKRENRGCGGFMYLPKGHPALEDYVVAAEKSGIQFDCFVGNAKEIKINNINLSPVAFNLSEKLTDTGVVIHHGGLGMAMWCLSFNIPQVICYRDTEKYLICEALQKIGHATPFFIGQDDNVLSNIIRGCIGKDMKEYSFSEMYTKSSFETLDAVDNIIF